MAGSSDSEGDYWPGYVDALTSMVKVLVFVMMLLAITVFVISQQISRTLVQKVAAAADVEVSKDTPLDQVADEIVKKLTDAKKAAAHLAKAAIPEATRENAKDEAKATSAVDAASPTDLLGQKVDVAPNKSVMQAKDVAVEPGGENDLVLRFHANTVQLDDATVSAVRAYAGAREGAARKFSLQGTTTIGGVSVTESRRAAYYRLMMVRQVFLNEGISADRIVIQLVDAKTTDETDTVRASVR